MNDAQIWAIIGVFTALMIGMLTVVSTLFTRVIRAEIGGLRGEMNARFEQMNTRFEAIDHRMDGLDRDVRALITHEFGLDRDE